MAISKISFNGIGQTPSASNGYSVAATSGTQEADIKVSGREEAEKEQAQTEELQKVGVIAESKDGDLLTGEKKSTYTSEEKTTVIAESEDGIVSRVDKVPTDDELITDLTGLSKSQVETLYLQGKISRHNYEQNMEKREKLQEADDRTNDNSEDKADSDFSGTMGQLIAEKSKEKMEADALSNSSEMQPAMMKEFAGVVNSLF